MSWLKRLWPPLGAKAAPAIPDELWQSSVARLPFLHRLNDTELARLRTLAQALLAHPGVAGAPHTEMDPLPDDIAVLVAAQAALPVLNLTPALYSDMAGILVYPAAFVVPHSEIDEDGVVHEWREPLAGEAIGDGGAVILSWEDTALELDAAAPGNIVIHEFAHKIDMSRGDANGYPPFLAEFHAAIVPQQWQHAFTHAYEDFCRRLDALEAQLPDDYDADAEETPAIAAILDRMMDELALDPYAASHPAEFFAVASEAFFVRPGPLADHYAEVYRLLALYYRQDPAAAMGDPPVSPLGSDRGGLHL